MVNTKNIWAIAMTVGMLATSVHAETEIIMYNSAGNQRLYWEYSVDSETGAPTGSSSLKVRCYGGTIGPANYFRQHPTSGALEVSPQSDFDPKASFPGTIWADAKDNYGGKPTDDVGGGDYAAFLEDGEFVEPEVDTDADDDGWDDDVENENGSDPNDPESVPSWDGWKLEKVETIPVDPDDYDGLTEIKRYTYTNEDEDKTLRVAVFDDGVHEPQWSLSSGSYPLESGITDGLGWPFGYVPIESSQQYGGGSTSYDSGSNTSGTNEASNPGGSSSFGGGGGSQTVTYPNESRDTSGDTSNTSSTTSAVEALRQTNQAIADDLYQAERATAAEVAATRNTLNNTLNKVGRAVEDVTKAVEGVEDAIESMETGSGENFADELMEDGEDVVLDDLNIDGLVSVISSKFPNVTQTIGTDQSFALQIPIKLGWNADTQYIDLPFKPDTSTALGAGLDNVRFIFRSLMVVCLLYVFFHGVIIALRQW